MSSGYSSFIEYNLLNGYEKACNQLFAKFSRPFYTIFVGKREAYFELPDCTWFEQFRTETLAKFLG